MSLILVFFVRLDEIGFKEVENSIFKIVSVIFVHVQWAFLGCLVRGISEGIRIFSFGCVNLSKSRKFLCSTKECCSLMFLMFYVNLALLKPFFKNYVNLSKVYQTI